MIFIHQLGQRILDFLIPPICPICKKRILTQHGLCATCFSEIHFIDKPYCIKCGRPFEFDIPEEMLCGSCCKKEPVFAKARSAFIYNSFSSQLILPFKHGDHLELTPLLTHMLYRAGLDLFDDIDMITAVPLHRFRFMKRKYNQAGLLAKSLSQKIKKPYIPQALIRIRHTKSQGHMKAVERKKNVAKAFAVKDTHLIKGKTILIIDDVFTTGATLNECAKTLLKAGATSIYVLTLARVTKI